MKKLQPKDLNFIKALTVKLPADGKTAKKRWVIAMPIVLFAVLGLAWGGLQLQYAFQLVQFDRETLAVTTMTGDESYRQAVKVEKQATDAAAAIANAEELRVVLDGYPALSKGFFDQINACGMGQVQVQSYNYVVDSAAFILTGTAGSVDQVADYVSRLRSTGLFDALSYTGYTTQDGIRYFFEITGMPKGQEGEPDAQ